MHHACTCTYIEGGNLLIWCGKPFVEVGVSLEYPLLLILAFPLCLFPEQDIRYTITRAVILYWAPSFLWSLMWNSPSCSNYICGVLYVWRCQVPLPSAPPPPSTAWRQVNALAWYFRRALIGHRSPWQVVDDHHFEQLPTCSWGHQVST